MKEAAVKMHRLVLSQAAGADNWHLRTPDGRIAVSVYRDVGPNTKVVAQLFVAAHDLLEACRDVLEVERPLEMDEPMDRNELPKWAAAYIEELERAAGSCNAAYSKAAISQAVPS